jgi:D-tyrosyl-tRNA(Tyr) deacylase
MRFLIQKVKDLKIEEKEVDKGFLIYVGVEKGDENKNLKEIVNYLENIQIVDKEGKFSQKIKDIKPKLIFVSNITLLANFEKFRINFNQALEPNKAKEIFDNFIKIWQDLGYEVFYKEFGSFLEISSTNLGPINFILEL